VIQNGEIPFSSRGVAPELALRYPNGQRSVMIGNYHYTAKAEIC